MLNFRMSEYWDVSKTGEEMNEQEPLVSIILPTYNRKNFLGKTIISVINQDYNNWELIIIDSGNDSTKVLVDAFTDTRIKYFWLDARRSKARNFGISQSSGEIISFIDSDDTFRVDKLRLEIDVFQENKLVGWVYSSAICKDGESGLEIGSYPAEKSGWLYQDIAYYKPLTFATSQITVRRNSLPASPIFNEKLDRFEDTDFFRRVARGSFGQNIPFELVTLVTHPGNSISNEDPVRTLNFIKIYLDIVNHDSQDLDSKFKRKSSANLYNFYGAAFLSVGGNPIKALKFFFRSISLSPFSTVIAFGKNFLKFYLWNKL